MNGGWDLACKSCSERGAKVCPRPRCETLHPLLFQPRRQFRRKQSRTPWPRFTPDQCMFYPGTRNFCFYSHRCFDTVGFRGTKVGAVFADNGFASCFPAQLSAFISLSAFESTIASHVLLTFIPILFLIPYYFNGIDLTILFSVLYLLLCPVPLLVHYIYL